MKFVLQYTVEGLLIGYLFMFYYRLNFSKLIEIECQTLHLQYLRRGVCTINYFPKSN